MKYKKGKKLETLGDVYVHLFEEKGIVIEETVGSWIYKVLDGKLMYRDQSNDRDFFQYHNLKLKATDEVFYKAVEDIEELELPKFFKVYINKETKGRDAVQSIDKNNVIDMWHGEFTCKTFWENFEEEE